VREGREQLNTDGDVTHFRNAKVIAAWIKGEPEPPDPGADQPPLFDENGDATGDEDGAE
jgi:hypothetical protein